MTDAQIIAWFTLEGYKAYNWSKDSGRLRRGVPYTIYKAGLTGWVCSSCEGVYKYNRYPDQEAEFPLTAVPPEELRAVYLRLEVNREP